MTGTILAALVLSAPTASVAADETQVLPGAMVAAGTGDVDGDGRREIVRLVRGPAEAMLLEVWREIDGSWLRVGGVPLVVPDATGNASLADRRLGAAAVLIARRDGRESVLALTAQAVPGGGFGRMCCLEVAEVGMAGGDGIELRPLDAPGLDREGAVVQSADLDGDGTDELVTFAVDVTSDGRVQATRIVVMAWRDGGFVAIGERETSDGLQPVAVAETNGLPGADLLGMTETGAAARLVIVDGEVVLERAQLPKVEPFSAWVAGVADGRLVLTGENGTSLVRWPAGSPPEAGANLDGGGLVVAVVGSETDALLIQPEGDPFARAAPGTIDVFDARARLIGDGLRAAPGSDGLWRFLERQARMGFNMASAPPFPYVGPLPAGPWAPAGGFAHGGVLVAPDGTGSFDTRDMSLLAGLFPLGSAGDGDAWLVTTNGVPFTSGSLAYLGAGMLDAGEGRVVAIPAAALLSEPRSDPAVSLELRGPVVELRDGSRTRLVAGASGFEVLVSAPPGSTVVHGGATRADLEVVEEPIVLTFTPGRASADEASDFEAFVSVATPTGTVTTREWTGRYVADAPSLDADGATEFLSLTATVRGRVAPDVAVTIDGRPVTLALDGSFEARIDAPPWPVGTVVMARDPLGNETTVRLEVIGVVDYRGLPWIALAGIATVVAGGYAFVRIPRRRGTGVRREEDGVLEDIDAA